MFSNGLLIIFECETSVCGIIVSVIVNNAIFCSHVSIFYKRNGMKNEWTVDTGWFFIWTYLNFVLQSSWAGPCSFFFLVHGHLTRQTQDNFRVYVMKMISEEPINPTNMLKYYKYIIAASEYIKKNDYSKGYVLIMDYTDINLVSLVTKVSPIDLHQTMILLTEGYGMRIKGIHIITPSRMVDALITLLKQVLSAKVAGRIHIHKTIDTVYKHVEKEILPQDYGGNELSLKKLNEAWFEVLSSREYTKYLNEMNKACTNESCRQKEKFHEQYLGTPGSFRTLSVD